MLILTNKRIQSCIYYISNVNKFVMNVCGEIFLCVNLGGNRFKEQDKAFTHTPTATPHISSACTNTLTGTITSKGSDTRLHGQLAPVNVKV